MDGDVRGAAVECTHLRLRARLGSIAALWVEPRSRIMFDNLGTPARFSDLDYFNLRWNSRITQQSSRLFEKRWGYRFYSEEAMYHWANRRRLFLLLRWLRLPIKLANLGDRLYSALVRRLSPVWDPLKDPYTPSRSLYAHFPNRQPVQKQHVIE